MTLKLISILRLYDYNTELKSCDHRITIIFFLKHELHQICNSMNKDLFVAE